MSMAASPPVSKPATAYGTIIVMGVSGSFAAARLVTFLKDCLRNDPWHRAGCGQCDCRNHHRCFKLPFRAAIAAWIGLVPRQSSSGGKERLGRITRQGDPYIRRLLVIGVTENGNADRVYRADRPHHVFASGLPPTKLPDPAWS